MRKINVKKQATTQSYVKHDMYEIYCRVVYTRWKSYLHILEICTKQILVFYMMICLLHKRSGVYSKTPRIKNKIFQFTLLRFLYKCCSSQYMFLMTFFGWCKLHLYRSCPIKCLQKLSYGPLY